jgi:hypothetical protein
MSSRSSAVMTPVQVSEIIAPYLHHWRITTQQWERYCPEAIIVSKSTRNRNSFGKFSECGSVDPNYDIGTTGDVTSPSRSVSLRLLKLGRRCANRYLVGLVLVISSRTFLYTTVAELSTSSPGQILEIKDDHTLELPSGLCLTI